MRLPYLLAVTAIALASCSRDAPADEPPPPRVVTLRQLADSDGDRCMSLSGWPERMSPGGDQLALPRPLGRGLVVMRAGRGTADLLPGREMITWSGDKTLWTMRTDGVIESWNGERLDPQTELNAFVAEQAPRKALGGLTGWRLVGGGDGLAVFGLVPFATPSRFRYRAIDLEARTVVTINVGKAWGERRPAVAVRTGRDATGAKYVFILHEVLDPGSYLSSKQRVDVFSSNGDRVFGGETRATEVSLTGRMTSAGPLILARQGEHRCLFVMTAAGALVSQGACTRDRGTVVLNRDLREAAFVPFNANETERPDGALERGRIVGIEDDRGRMIYETITAAGRVALERGTPGPSEQLFAEFAPNFCSPVGIATGEAIQARASDGAVSEGVLFRPRTPPAGLVVSYHGGPYQTWTDMEGGTVAAFVEQGFAVVAVNYRGTPGYGTRFIERAYESGPRGMLEDGRALTDAARERLGSRDVPVYVEGGSWGGYLALRELTDPNSTVKGGFLVSAICRIDLTVDDVTYTQDVTPISRVIDPSTVIHQIKLNGPPGVDRRLNVCNDPLPAGRRVFVTHSQRDPTAPFRPIQEWSRAQGDAVRMVVSPGSAHPYPSRDEAAPIVTQVIRYWGEPQRSVTK